VSAAIRNTPGAAPMMANLVESPEQENVMEKPELIYPSCMREAAELGYEVVGGDCLISEAKFVSANEMNWEGELELDLCLDGDKSDGSLGTVRVKAKAHYTFEVIEPK
jgi:hypothetical protein